MELNIKEVRLKTKEKLLSYDGVEEAYDNLADAILDQANMGRCDILVYLSSYEDQEAIWSALAILELDGFSIKRFDGTDIVNIGWRNDLL